MAINDKKSNQTLRRTIGVVTGGRADYGLLYPVMKRIQSDPLLSLSVYVTGMHLSKEHGLTAQKVIDDGFPVVAQIDILQSGDSARAVTQAVSVGVARFAEIFEKNPPDLLLVLGDRFEIFAAVQAALFAKVPVAHIGGGDVTEGAFDESIRHSITKMSHLHFVTNKEAERRVRQLGEDSAAVFNFGSPGVDLILQTEILSRSEFENSIQFKLFPKNFLVTFHPPTMDAISPVQQFQELLKALDKFGDQVGLIMTRPNADVDGDKISEVLNRYAAGKKNVCVHSALGQQRYYSAIHHVDLVVGNSSSGLCEVPSFKKPTVNVGDRQKGRLAPHTVLHCASDAAEIYDACLKALALDCSNAVNPYGAGDSAEKIVGKLSEIQDYKTLVKKHFYVYGREYDSKN